MTTLYQRGQRKAQLDAAKAENRDAAAAMCHASLAAGGSEYETHNALMMLLNVSRDLRYHWEWWRVRPLSQEHPGLARRYSGVDRHASDAFGLIPAGVILDVTGEEVESFTIGEIDLFGEDDKGD